MPGHIDQRFARDVEHLLPMRGGDQVPLVSGKGASAIQRIADAHRDDLRDTQTKLLAQDLPDFPGFLTSNRGHQVEIENCSRYFRFNLSVKLFFEPLNVPRVCPPLPPRFALKSGPDVVSPAAASARSTRHRPRLCCR